MATIKYIILIFNCEETIASLLVGGELMYKALWISTMMLWNLPKYGVLCVKTNQTLLLFKAETVFQTVVNTTGPRASASINCYRSIEVNGVMTICTS